MISALYVRIIATTLALGLLFGAGWYVCSAHDAKKEVKTLQADKHDTAVNIERAVEQSIKVDADIDKDHDRINTIRDQVAERLSKPTYATRHDPVYDLNADPARIAEVGLPRDAVDHDPVLDAGTVRLLNAARAGTELGATAGRDAEVENAAAAAR